MSVSYTHLASRFHSPDAFSGYQIKTLGGGIVIVRDAIPLHPHNAALQIWFELGAIGAAIVACGFFVFIRHLRKITARSDQSATLLLQMSIISFFVIAELGYGIWQNRWIAFFMMALVLWALTFPRKDRSS